MNSFDTCCLSTATIATAADDDDGNNAVNGAGSCTAAASHERYSGRRRGHATGVAAAVVPALSSSPFPRLRAARCRGLARCRQADWKISSRSHGGRLAISSLHRDGEAARSELKHADDAPPLNTDGDHWHYRRRSREDEAAPFPPSSIRGSPIRRNISIQISSPGTRFSHQGLGSRNQTQPRPSIYSLTV
ncbi:Os01g0888044 [Oryza sativa Japonica Group]|uniref:Os01g0888044 protein n=1 Tax=Oryza sativa subsp. japonica TaxID=39947 RepID=A0A0P0VBC9_ORYSJ|nr:Os01g0888044 [Oryza sativa Japonica Group]